MYNWIYIFNMLILCNLEFPAGEFNFFLPSEYSGECMCVYSFRFIVHDAYYPLKLLIQWSLMYIWSAHVGLHVTSSAWRRVTHLLSRQFQFHIIFYQYISLKTLIFSILKFPAGEYFSVRLLNTVVIVWVSRILCSSYMVLIII